MSEEKQHYPIDERCKDCSLFLVVEEMKKKIEYLEAKVSSLEKELERINAFSRSCCIALSCTKYSVLKFLLNCIFRFDL